MKKIIICIFSFFLVQLVKAQDCGPINFSKLKELLVGLGFDPKPGSDTGKTTKWIIANTGSGLNVPTGYEISPSTNYIWITINLGVAPESWDDKNNDLLKKNTDIQPCFFYITKQGNLQIALAVENRAVTSAVLKRCNDFIVKRVGDTKELWQQ